MKSLLAARPPARQVGVRAPRAAVVVDERGEARAREGHRGRGAEDAVGVAPAERVSGAFYHIHRSPYDRVGAVNAVP